MSPIAREFSEELIRGNDQKALAIIDGLKPRDVAALILSVTLRHDRIIGSGGELDTIADVLGVFEDY